MSKNKVNVKKQKILQAKKDERIKKILHHCSWVFFIMAAFLLMLFGSEKVETSPYVFIVVGLVGFAILLRLLIILPERYYRRRRIGKV